MNRALWFAGAVCTVAALADLWVVLRPAPNPIPEASMRAAAEAVKSIRNSGDHVVHSPLFSVTELRPLGDLKARPDKPTDGIRASRRVVVIDRVGWSMGGLGSPDEVRAVSDEIELRVFLPRGSGEASLYELLTAFDERTLTIERPVGRVSSRCTATRAEGGYKCPGEAEWLYIAPRTLRIGGSDRQCLWAHPTTGGAVVFTIPAQEKPPPGRILELVVQAGLTDDAVTGTPGGAPVQLAIQQGSRRVGALTVQNEVGWFPAKQTITAEEPVRIVITTARDGRRHLCLDARITEKAP